MKLWLSFDEMKHRVAKPIDLCLSGTCLPEQSVFVAGQHKKMHQIKSGHYNIAVPCSFFKLLNCVAC